MLSIEDLQKTPVGILGFGKEGQAVARFLKRHKVVACILDTKPADTFSAVDLAQWQAAGFSLEIGMPFANLSRFGVLFRSPGVPRLGNALVEAESHGVIITSQTKWFFDHCPARIIGVTGTKGKGTTVSLIARIIDQGREHSLGTSVAPEAKVYITGNIGKRDPFDLLDELTKDDIVVFELSSFQLQDLTVSPWIGVCLMVTQEHLDYHSSLAEYHAAKASIAAYQKPADMLVYAQDYPASRAIAAQGKGARYAFSRVASVSPGVTIEGEQIRISGMPTEGVFDVSHRLLRGAHNLENVAAASGVGALLGIPLASIAESVNSFPGLEHRLEFVGIFSEVNFYNDSISTTPESAIAAVQSFREPLVLILGGSDKGSDFTQLGQTIAHAPNIRGVILVGQMTERIHTALAQAHYEGVVLVGAASMPEIFAQVRLLAKPGDVVLLSPACASFGMFKNYADRGEQFKSLAKVYSALPGA